MAGLATTGVTVGAAFGPVGAAVGGIIGAAADIFVDGGGMGGAPAGPVISGGGQTPFWGDNSGWTVATGGGSASAKAGDRSYSQGNSPGGDPDAAMVIGGQEIPREAMVIAAGVVIVALLVWRR